MNDVENERTRTCNHINRKPQVYKAAPLTCRFSLFTNSAHEPRTVKSISNVLLVLEPSMFVVTGQSLVSLSHVAPVNNDRIKI